MARGYKGKYTPETHAAIVKALQAGAFKQHAADAARVSIDALEDWVLKGDAGIEPYVQFAEDVHQAIAQDAVANQAIITRAARGVHEGDWKAAAWNLEKKFPKLYGKLAEAPTPDLERPKSPWAPQPPAAAGNARKLDS